MTAKSYLAFIVFMATKENRHAKGDWAISCFTCFGLELFKGEAKPLNMYGRNMLYANWCRSCGTAQKKLFYSPLSLLTPKARN